MSSIRYLSIAFLAVCFVACECLTVLGQDEQLDLVDQHGQKVELHELGISSKPVPHQQQGKAQSGETTQTGKVIQTGKPRANIHVSDGKIVIVEHDGTKREIDVSGAQNIVVSKSVQSIMENGQQQNKMTGKAIIIGPDGERQEFELNDGFEGLDGKFKGVFEMLPFGHELSHELPLLKYRAATGSGKYMIGVNCSPVSGQLRSHLDLEEGVGLVVASDPRDGTPAAEAGVARHDILMSANSKPLSTTNVLSEIVQAAGNDNQSVTLTLVRRGNEMSVELKPVKRQQLKSRWRFDSGPGLFVPDQVGQNFELERVGPGLLFEAEQMVPADMLKRMESLEERIQQRMQEFSRMQQEFLRSMPKAGGELDSNEDG